MAPNLVHSPRDGTVSATQNRPGRLREFDEVTLPAGQRVEARRVRIGDIPLLLGQGEAGMGVALAPAITVARIARAHPDSLWGFWRHGRFVGGFAFLMLNRHGVEALIGDALDLGDPPTSVLAAPGDRPAGIYVWALLRSSAVAAEGIARVIVRLQQLRVAGHGRWPEIHARTGFPSRAGASAFAAPLPAICQSPRASEVVHECCME